MKGKKNVIVIVADTFRTAFLGCYGNDWIKTPNLDRFAGESMRFTNAHPESLPTIPTRRTLHTGRRAFPFHDYAPVPWDNVYIPGWQPMSPDEATIAEAMVQAGYHTGFFSDVPHYFVPGMNFTRGFLQWAYIRGQAEDRYRATGSIDPSRIAIYKTIATQGDQRIRAHIANVRPERPEETWPAARTFRAAIEFLETNTQSQPFYLYLDSFTPHETWEAPLHYYDLYGRRKDREPVCLTVPYGPVAESPDLSGRIESIRANYAGLVTMVDTWFGRLMETVDRLGLREETLVVFLSDHGTNFADNAEGILGKPAGYMYPGTMRIPLMVRHPEGRGAGMTSDELVYSLDVPATVLSVTGASPMGPTEGFSLLPLLESSPGFSSRDYLTCRYGNFVWYRDRSSWFFSHGDFTNPRLFDLEADPDCAKNIEGQAPDRLDRARQAILNDAGGEIVIYTRQKFTDAIGRPEFV